MWYYYEGLNPAFSVFASIWIVSFWIMVFALAVWGIKLLLDVTEKRDNRPVSGIALNEAVNRGESTPEETGHNGAPRA